MNFGGMEIPYGESNCELVVEPRMGHEDLTRPVDHIEQSLVALIDCEIGVGGGGVAAEADDTEGDGGEEFKVVARLDPGGEQSRKSHVFGESVAQALRAEVPHHHP